MAAGIAADRYAVPRGGEAWGRLALVSAVAAVAGLRCRPVAGLLALLALAAALGGGRHHAAWSVVGPGDLARGVDEGPRPAWVRGVLFDVIGVRPGDPGV